MNALIGQFYEGMEGKSLLEGSLRLKVSLLDDGKELFGCEITCQPEFDKFYIERGLEHLSWSPEDRVPIRELKVSFKLGKSSLGGFNLPKHHCKSASQ